MVIEQTKQDFAFAAGCKAFNSTCVSSTECCSGFCSTVGKCSISRCRPMFASCNPLSSTCCSGLQCDPWKKTCCRRAGQSALTPSECCSNSWKPNTNGNAGGICCSQHAGPCSSAADCCSSADHCANPQWPNMCV